MRRRNRRRWISPCGSPMDWMPWTRRGGRRCCGWWCVKSSFTRAGFLSGRYCPHPAQRASLCLVNCVYAIRMRSVGTWVTRLCLSRARCAVGRPGPCSRSGHRRPWRWCRGLGPARYRRVRVRPGPWPTGRVGAPPEGLFRGAPPSTDCGLCGRTAPETAARTAGQPTGAVLKALGQQRLEAQACADLGCILAQPESGPPARPARG